MSVDLYWRRLVYDKGRGGIAKEGPLKLLLQTPPPIFPNAVQLDIGEVQAGQLAYDPILRNTAGGPRVEVTPPEIIAFRIWMAGLLAAVMRKAKRPPVIKEERRRAR